MSAAEPLPCEDRYPREPSDTCSKDGAWKLALQIEAYWRARGQVVNTRIVSKGYSLATRAIRYEVQTDLVDGMPAPNAKQLTNGPVEVKWERDQ